MPQLVVPGRRAANIVARCRLKKFNFASYRPDYVALASAIDQHAVGSTLRPLSVGTICLVKSGTILRASRRYLVRSVTPRTFGTNILQSHRLVNVQMQCRDAYRIEESFHEYDKLSDVASAEKASPLQQFYLVPWRWMYFVQHRREVNRASSTLLFVYQWYRFLFLDIGLHLALLFAIRVLRLRWAIRAMIGRIVPLFVIQDWRVVGPSNTQMVMEHELFRHIELELFVQRSQLDSAIEYLQNVLEVAGGSTAFTI